MGSPAPLVVEEHRDGAGAAVLDEVGESWLEMIPIGELKRVPSEEQNIAPLKGQWKLQPLHSSIKDEASLSRVCLGVILFPEINEVAVGS